MADAAAADLEPPSRDAEGGKGTGGAGIPAAGREASWPRHGPDSAPQVAPSPSPTRETDAVQANSPHGAPLQRVSSSDSRTRSLVRQVSDRFSGSLGVAPTFFCQICFDNVPVSEGYTLQACGHRFCRNCLSRYIRVAVFERNTDLCCHYADGGGASSPGGDSVCKTAFAEPDIFALCDAEAAHKYRLFKDDSLRECPRCRTLVSGSSSAPALTCPACDTRFCYFHATAHSPDEPCPAYQRRMKREERINRDAALKDSKECPHCGSLTSKSGGCNHITCPVCHKHWCWLCRKKVGSGELPTHYMWWNLLGCPNRQMNEDGSPLTGWRNVCYRLFSFLLFLVLGVPAAALTLACTAPCCPCLAATGAYRRVHPSRSENVLNPGNFMLGCFSGWGYALLGTVLFCAALPFLVIAAFSGALSWCCQACSRRAGAEGKEGGKQAPAGDEEEGGGGGGGGDEERGMEPVVAG